MEYPYDPENEYPEDLPEKSPAPRRRISWTRVLLIVLCAVLALVLIVLVLVTILGNRWLNMIGHETHGTLSSKDLENLYSDATTDPNFSGETMNPSDIIWTSGPQETIFDGEEYVNIMLVGQDRRWNETVSRSDAMVLLTFNKNTGTIYMTSFLRDTYVQIPGYKDNRMNAAYAIGGMSLLEETVELNFGVPVDGTLSVDFFRFPEIIDMMGGLDLTLTQEEADYLNRRGNWGLGPDVCDWTLTVGVNRMTGEQCLAFSRLRDIGTDTARVERQHKVLMALFEKVKNLPLREAVALMDQFLPMVTTNMSNKELLTHAYSLFPMLSDCDIYTQRIPKFGDYEPVRINGMAVLLPNLEAIRQQLIDTLAHDIYATASAD